jgi:hypothetical protein
MYIVVRTNPQHSELSPAQPGLKSWRSPFFFKNSKCLSFSNTLILFIWNQISKTFVVLECKLYKLSIPHKDGPFQHTSGLTRIVMWNPLHFFPYFVTFKS